MKELTIYRFCSKCKRPKSLVVELHSSHSVVYHSDPFPHLTCRTVVQHVFLLSRSQLVTFGLKILIATQTFKGSLLDCSILTPFPLFSKHYDDIFQLILKESQTLLHFYFFGFLLDYFMKKMHSFGCPTLVFFIDLFGQS